VKLRVDPIHAPLRSEFLASHGSVSTRELLLVTLETAAGELGHGEAAPLPSYDGVTIAEVGQALEACRAVLANADSKAHSDVMARCAEVALLPQALAAIDLALWDLAAQRARVPVWQLLGASPPGPVPVNWTIASADRSGAAREAAQARAAGFRTVKAKVAIGDDHGRLAAVRAVAGPQMAIRIDANGAWSLPEAEAALRLLAPVGIELCEEPVRGLAAIRDLASRTSIPLALDESANDPDALEDQACPFICLKVSACGGISGLLDTAYQAKLAGYEVLLASTLDGPLGIAAALHAAAVLIPERACGLATLAMFAGRQDPLGAERGTIPVPAGPGLGDGLLDWYRAG
jgi:o-succinylbenzoate synthase